MSNNDVTTVEYTSNSMSTESLIFDFNIIDKMNQLANMMAESKVAIPSHLRGNAGDCLAVIMQAAQWGMNPFSVAQKTFVVHGILGYEAQLVNAVIASCAPVETRIEYEWFGKWENIIGKFTVRKNNDGKEYRVPAWGLKDEDGCGIKVWATFKGEDQPRVLTLLLSQARTRNSTLWADDPRQQLAYLAVKRWARLYCPDVIMGVYTPDEIIESRTSCAPAQPKKSIKSLLEENALEENAHNGDDSNGDNVTIEYILELILKAQDSASLKKIAKQAYKLTDNVEIEIARAAYRDRNIQIQRQNNIDKGNVTFEQLKKEMENAKTAIEMDDILNRSKHLGDSDQKILATMYEQRT